MYTGWSNHLSRITIWFILILFLLLYLVFWNRTYEIAWMVAAIVIFSSVMNGINSAQKRWILLDISDFRIRLFWIAVFLRLLAMFTLLLISYNTWDSYYIVGSKDEMVYYRVGSEAATILRFNDISAAYNYILSSYKGEISDTGFSTIIMLLITVLGYSPILIKIFLCVIGGITVLRGYKLAGMLIEEPAAKVAGLLLAFYPVSWFYSSIMLKENIMVLLIIESVIMIVRIQKAFTPGLFIKTMLLITSLFFFRSAISILLFMVFGFSVFMQFKRRNVFVNILISILIIIVYIYFLKSTGRFDEYYYQYTNINEFTQERLTFIESINPFVAFLGSPAFAALSYISPFPSVVAVPVSGGLSHSEYYYHVAGNLFWIVLAFFSFYGLYYSVKNKRLDMIALTSFVIGYQFVLLKAMMFTSVRFSYPAKPFLLILAAYGIYHMKNKKWYPVYLFAAAVMIIGWNYVRLKGRS